MAKECGFNSAEKWTYRSCRRTGLTALNSHGVGGATALHTAWHKNITTTALYQEPTEEALVTRAKAIQVRIFFYPFSFVSIRFF